MKDDEMTAVRVVLVTPIGAKRFFVVMQMPISLVMLWQEDASWKVVGSNPGVSKGFFLAKSQ